jgi:hypothetical protein
VSSGPRILQVLADTDASPVNRAAVDLHAALASAGAELRTIALAPGRTGELATVVPAVAPARRTVAALTALRSEATWADVLLFQGSRALPPGVDRLRSLPPMLLRLVDGDAVSERRLARLGARTRVTLLLDDGPPAVDAGPAAAGRAVIPRGASAGATADLVLAALDDHRPTAP